MKQIKTLHRLVIAFLILGALSFAAGCSFNNGGSNSQDGNLNTLETVLENTYSGPDKKLNKILDNPENATRTVIGDDDNAKSKSQKSPTELALYLEEMYEPHFTEDMYKDYVGRYVFSYQAKEKNEMEVKAIDISQTETDDNIYDFTADIEYQKEGNETQVYELKGQASFSEKGKIKEFALHSDDDLSKTLSES